MRVDRRSFIIALLITTTLPVRGWAADAPLVAITAIVEHPALDACRDGVIEGLKQQGVAAETTYESAQGQPATAAQIARSFVGMAPAVIVAISTPSAQAAASATKDIPIVFTAVTDPVGAGLVTDLARPGGNVTGLSDLSPLAQHLDLILEISPQVKTLGIPYNPGEANAVTLLRLMTGYANERGIQVVEATASKSADVVAAARSLAGQVDAIYVPTDNTIVSALESLIVVARQAKIPVFSGDTDSVARGCIGSIGFDYFQVGVQTAAIVARVLKGEKPGDLAVEVAQGTDLVLNPTAAAAFGVTIPEAVLSRAAKIVGA
ncbi:MAG TPA: ABC transporter substrate-binding protein [Geminicoccus sp.]|uniref:ABC transporter substrate-binding protein n=1 Tax=Geminicoccus sp. TaxID=2024832 RepID=UPI002E368058|nr:ABC transporter substrate-binding protein [Geminicoccus sp.]HEX2526983.1 ABC transporter substrate-binding protein [Geminicoccus sp.]